MTLTFTLTLVVWVISRGLSAVVVVVLVFNCELLLVYVGLTEISLTLVLPVLLFEAVTSLSVSLLITSQSVQTTSLEIEVTI